PVTTPPMSSLSTATFRAGACCPRTLASVAATNTVSATTANLRCQPLPVMCRLRTSTANYTALRSTTGGITHAPELPSQGREQRQNTGPGGRNRLRDTRYLRAMGGGTPIHRHLPIHRGARD